MHAGVNAHSYTVLYLKGRLKDGYMVAVTADYIFKGAGSRTIILILASMPTQESGTWNKHFSQKVGEKSGLTPCVLVPGERLR